MKRLFCLVLLFIITGCSPSDAAIQTAVNQTQIAQPTLTPTQTPIPTNTPEPTPTSIPLSEVNLEGILLLPGDLPSEFTMQQIRNEFQGIRFPVTISPPEQISQMELRAGIYGSDGTVIFLFDSIDDINEFYPVAQSQVLRRPREELSGVGETASAYTENLLGVQSTQIIFIRCHALVYIDLFSPSANIDVAITYAERLDERLSGLVCR